MSSLTQLTASPRQSSSTRQPSLAAQPSQPFSEPPQSTPVSSPFMVPSVHVAHTCPGVSYAPSLHAYTAPAGSTTAADGTDVVYTVTAGDKAEQDAIRVHY